MCYYNGAQRYEHFLQVGRLYRALILLGLALYLYHGAIYVVNFLGVTSLSFSELSLMELALDLVDYFQGASNQCTDVCHI